ncbi:hypothetical protein [uncultured Sphaerochaeta sp.]|jgi:antitoxin component of RelBE/YafQ-DinJ toxin-antitoxin module|uniref:hypothetical protein n=1 Tax=uncultured Sphaerochaeta sp. TaxID=886478 RepID=UPI002AA650CF|nr:hypothetical protein [uncultured Sphaerochaeta sp.]
MKTVNTVYVGVRIPQEVVIEAKKYVAERPGLTLSKLYELAVQEYISSVEVRQSTDKKTFHKEH